MNPQVIPLPKHHDETPCARVAGQLPAVPRTPADTGLPLQLQTELLLKVMQQHGLTHVQELSSHLKLPIAVLEALFTHLRRDTLVEVRRRGALDGDVSYNLTQAGRTRASEALARNLYCGPAPVSLADYTAEDVRTAYRTPKSCAPMCTVSCVHKVSAFDFFRGKQTEG